MKEVGRLLVVCIMAVLGCAGISYGALDDGLVGFWSFDACTADDDSGTGNDGYFVGNNQCVPGVNGSALQFNGYYDPGYVNVPNTSSLSFLDNYTFTLWFNIQSNTSMDGYGQVSEYGYHTLFAKAGDRNGLDLRVFRATEDGLLYLGLGSGWCCGIGRGGGIASIDRFDVKEWHMATVTSGSGEVKLYFDCKLQGSVPTALFDVNPSMQYMPLQLGIDQDAWWYPINGMLDEVRVYNRDLAAAEVQQLFEPTFNNQPPVIGAVAVTPNVLWPPDHQLVPVTVSASATDNCDPAPVCRITEVASNEPVDGLGDSDTAPDWIITGDLTLSLRAERAGSGVGRLYTITVSCADASGNASEAAALVTVPLSLRR
jgi:hypothetical protein